MCRFTLYACLLACVFFAPAASAGSDDFASGTSVLSNQPAVTSVHELQVPKKARALCEDGVNALRSHDPARSVSQFQKAIKAYPDYFEAYSNLGTAEVQLKRWDEAIAAFRKSIDLSRGSFAPPHFGLALVLSAGKQQFAEAEGIVRSGLQLAPGNAAGNYVLGWILYSTNRLVDAEKSAREALISAPDMGAAMLLLAQIHIREKKPDLVVQELDSYLSLSGSSPLNDKVRAIRAQELHQLTSANVKSVAANVRP
jgi:tetratricopeptide (TPR) repeat protein